MKLIQGDCLDKMKKIPKESVDLIIADYPFKCQDGKKDYDNFVFETSEEFYRLLKTGGNLVVINNPFNLFKTVRFFQEFSLRNSIALIRKGSFGVSYHFRFQHNYALILCKGDTKKKWNGNMGLTDKSFTYNDKLLTDVIEYQNGYRSKLGWHPQALPEKLVKMFVEILSNKGDVVLDPFLGSGTTAVVCQKEKRNFIGIEINPKYISMTTDRLSQQLSL